MCIVQVAQTNENLAEETERDDLIWIGMLQSLLGMLSMNPKKSFFPFQKL